MAGAGMEATDALAAQVAGAADVLGWTEASVWTKIAAAALDYARVAACPQPPTTAEQARPRPPLSTGYATLQPVPGHGAPGPRDGVVVTLYGPGAVQARVVLAVDWLEGLPVVDGTDGDAGVEGGADKHGPPLWHPVADFHGEERLQPLWVVRLTFRGDTPIAVQVRARDAVTAEALVRDWTSGRFVAAQVEGPRLGAGLTVQDFAVVAGAAQLAE